MKGWSQLPSNRQPAPGTNSLWPDMHVEWHNYDHVVHYGKNVAAGDYPEGYAHAEPHGAGTPKIWTKNSARVY